MFANFDEMMKTVRPDTVIVTTVDRYHHEYIIKALEYGCDVITEKPLTIDEDKCNAILEAERKTGKKVIVTFITDLIRMLPESKNYCVKVLLARY